jgi:hypothetical protein
MANNNLMSDANSPHVSGTHNFQFTSCGNIVRNNIYRDNTGDDGHAMSLYVHHYGSQLPPALPEVADSFWELKR